MTYKIVCPPKNWVLSSLPEDWTKVDIAPLMNCLCVVDVSEHPNIFMPKWEIKPEITEWINHYTDEDDWRWTISYLSLKELNIMCVSFYFKEPNIAMLFKLTYY